MMLATIGAILMVALLQTVSARVRSAKWVILPQLGVWALLAFGLIVAKIAPLQPAPLTVTVGDKVLSVPRAFLPNATMRYIPKQGRSFPIYDFRVCSESVDPPFESECRSSLVQVNTDPEIGSAFSALAGRTAFEAHLEKNGLGTEPFEGIVDEDGSVRVFKLNSG